MRYQYLWVDKYSSKIEEQFPDSIGKLGILTAGVDTKPVGKTTVAKALCKELGVDYYVINGSDEGRFLDTVRNNAKNFAATVSLASEASHKVIIIDEADNTTSDVTGSFSERLLRSSNQL